MPVNSKMEHRYTRVSARHNWDASAPLWVQFLERTLSEKCSKSKRLFYLLLKLRTIICNFRWRPSPYPFPNPICTSLKTPYLNRTHRRYLFIQQKVQSKVVCSPPRVVSWNVMSKKKRLSKRTSRKRTKKKKKKHHRKTSLTGFEPPTNQSEIIKLSTAPRGIRRLLTVEELIFLSLHGFSSHSSWLTELSEPILRLE